MGAIAKQGNSSAFVLLCGCPRSGTTLVAQHFGRSLGIAMPDETHFIPHFRRFLWLWGDLRRPQKQRTLLEALTAYAAIWTYYGSRSADAARLASVSLHPVLERMAPLEGGFADVLATAYRAYADQTGFPYFGDKSASFEPENIDLYDRSVRDLRVIHLIRDGRDVYRSWSAEWFGPRTAADAAFAWKRHIRVRRAWGARNPSRYLEIRYEDFVSDTAVELRRVADFLGLPEPRGELYEDVLGRALSGEAAHAKLRQGVDPSNAGRWRELPREQVRTFEFVAGRALETCDYPVERRVYSYFEKIRFSLRSVTGLLNRIVSSNFYLRRARAWMPLLLRMAQWLRIPLNRLVGAVVTSTPII